MFPIYHHLFLFFITFLHDRLMLLKMLYCYVFIVLFLLSLGNKNIKYLKTLNYTCNRFSYYYNLEKIIRSKQAIRLIHSAIQRYGYTAINSAQGIAHLSSRKVSRFLGIRFVEHILYVTSIFKISHYYYVFSPLFSVNKRLLAFDFLTAKCIETSINMSSFS